MTVCVVPWRYDGTLGRCAGAGSRGGGLPAVDCDACDQCDTVERCIIKLKQWRGLATWYDKTATIYLAGLRLAGIFIWSAR